ncbi:MAG: nuclear transport factor 2 family protein [Pseudomonadota bacterium]
MDDLARLVAHREITDVLVDYCRHLDAMDLAGLAALFTAECRVTYGPDPRLEARGRGALEASLARMWRWRRTAHHLSTIRIWIESGDSAQSESAVWAWHEAQDGTAAGVYGLYHDKLVHDGGRWLISERRMEMRGTGGAFRVPVPPAYRAPPPPGWRAPEGLDD